MKQEPTKYSFDQLVADGRTMWDGVRNFQARNNLKAMRTGDRVLFYHSVVGTAVVGVCEVVREAYPDPDREGAGWVAVDLAPVKALEAPRDARGDQGRRARCATSRWCGSRASASCRSSRRRSTRIVKLGG